MLGERASFEWQVGDSETWDRFEPVDWVSTSGAISQNIESPSHRTAGRWHRSSLRNLLTGRVLRGLLVLTVLAAMVIGFGVWQDYQAGLRRIRTDIQSTIELEAWAWQNDDQKLAGNLIDTQQGDEWANRFRWSQGWRRHWAGDDARMPTFEIESMELRDDLALVEVLATRPGEPWMSTSYRETRFYRQVEDRWLRTAPQAAFWGAGRSIETEHFHFEFRQRDTAVVEAVSIEIEALYAGLRRDVGLAPPAGEQLTVAVVPDTDVASWRFVDDKLTIPSPALLQVPEDVPDEARLTRSILYPLAQRAVDEAVEGSQVGARWRPLVDGIHHWLSWEGHRLPSAWRYHVEELLREELRGPAPARLNHLVTSGHKAWHRSEWWVRVLAGETVVDYAVGTYGRDRLPAFVQTLGEHEAWDTLVPAVFGVSVEEFEAGWQAYLAKRFGMPGELQARSGTQPSSAEN